MEHQKKQKILKWVIGLSIATIIILLVFDSSIPKRFINYLNEDIKKENEAIQRKIDSISRERSNDSIFYESLIKDLQEENRIIQNKVNSANYKLRQYEEAFKNYNSGDFYTNYLLFTRFVQGSDTIPPIR